MRVLAYLLDSVVVGVALSLPGAMVWDANNYAWPEEALADFAVVFGYYVALEAWRGQTLGKRLCRLRVVMVDGSPANLTAIVARRFTFFLVLSWIPVVLAVLVGWEMACIASLLGVIVLIGTVQQSYSPSVPRSRCVGPGGRSGPTGLDLWRAWRAGPAHGAKRSGVLPLDKESRQ
jgi:uncharacterized RDD family membrane protein YckC